MDAQEEVVVHVGEGLVIQAVVELRWVFCQERRAEKKKKTGGRDVNLQQSLFTIKHASKTRGIVDAAVPLGSKYSQLNLLVQKRKRNVRV